MRPARHHLRAASTLENIGAVSAPSRGAPGSAALANDENEEITEEENRRKRNRRKISSNGYSKNKIMASNGCVKRRKAAKYRGGSESNGEAKASGENESEKREAKAERKRNESEKWRISGSIKSKRRKAK